MHERQPGKEGSLSITWERLDQGFAQGGPRPIAVASPGSVLECEFPGPPQTHQVSHRDGGAQRSVGTSSPGAHVQTA